MSDHLISGLSESCNAVLAAWDMYAKPSGNGISAEVYDCDGEYQTTVRRNIDPSDLLALLRYGRYMLGTGRKIGEEHVRASMRALIGAAPNARVQAGP
jgi:hypothetical protein